MKALFRALLAAVGVLALLVVCGVVYVTTFLDPNDLKPRLVEAVHQRTGLDLSLNGPLSWTFYPRLGVTVEDAEARLPGQQSSDTPFAAFRRADVKVKFAPLLAGDVSVDGVTLDGLRLELARDAQGHGNWETLLEHMAQEDGTVSETRPRETSRGLDDAANRPLGVDIANVQVSDGQVHYVDEQQQRDLLLSHLTLTSSNVTPGRFFPLELAFDLESRAPALTSHVALESDVQVNLREARYQLRKLALKTTSQLPALGTDQTQALNLNADELIADLVDQQYRLNGASLGGTLKLAQFGDKGVPFNLKFSADADLASQVGHLSDAVLTSGDNLKLSAALTVNQLLGKPRYEGQLQLAPMNLRDWLERVGIASPQTADPKALTRVGLSSPLQGTGERLELIDLALSLDDRTLAGQLGARLDDKAVDFDLHSDSLDLDAYLPPRQDKPKEAALLRGLGIAPAFAATEGAALLPVELLRALDLDGTLKVGELKLKGMTLTDMALRAKGADGQHRLEQLSANLYGGTLNASGSLDVRQTPIEMALDETLDKVQLEPLLRDAAQRDRLMRGSLALKGKFTSRTNELGTLKRNLNGNATFAITDGAIVGTNVSEQLCTTVATLQGKESTREWGEDTPFDRFGATAKVIDGVVHNDDLLIAIPGIELTGQGQANLATERFDYLLGARFVDTADQQACKVSERLQKVKLPVRCEGEFSDEPGQWCRFDREGFQHILAGLAADEGKQQLQKRLNDKLDGDLGKKLDEKLGEGAGKELRNALQGLFK